MAYRNHCFVFAMSHQCHLHSQSPCQGCVELIHPFRTVCAVGNFVLAVNPMNLIADAYNALRTASYLGENVELE